MKSAFRLLLAALCIVHTGLSADPFYVGSWKITSAVVAPWWTEQQKPDPSETKTLLDQSVMIGVHKITGPRQVGCNDPHYKIKNYPADMLFQGMFGERHSRDKAFDPGKAAESVGFKGKTWKTLETGCENEIELHFLDDRTAAFGLNNYIYILQKK